MIEMKNIVGGEGLFRFHWKAMAVVALAGVIGFGGYIGSGVFSQKLETEAINNLQKAVQRAIVQCYALEGQYPPAISYLEENYGLQIDKEKYLIDYNNFASNIMPQATVIPLAGQMGGQ